jgi:hypothetical protein
MVARCACILLVKLQSQVLWPETAIIQALRPFWGKSYTEEELGQKVRSMLAKGSCYRNIDQELGPGSYLLLGKDFGESRLALIVCETYFN